MELLAKRAKNFIRNIYYKLPLNRLEMAKCHQDVINALASKMDNMDGNLLNFIELKIRYSLLVHHDQHRCKNVLPSDDLYEPANPESYDNYLNKLRAINPELFTVWYKLFENGKKSYLEQRSASCSMHHNMYCQIFKTFINLHRQGRILDIGCGIYGLPYYLEDCPLELVSAIEPLEMVRSPRFEVVQGFAEFLPWKDQSFGTIVCGTSLDHVLCLETSLKEIRRVLRSDGKFVIWISALEGAKPFDKTKKPYQAIDDYHLFHFDYHWFEELITPYFIQVEKLIYPCASFDHVFYSLSPKPA